jgi:BatD DUF11 like domain
MRRFFQFSIFNFQFALALLAVSASANNLTVDRRSIHLDDTLLITVTLENEFAAVDSVKVPTTNLVIEGAASTSTELEIVNGSMSRRKIFQFRAHGKEQGTALVGPLIVTSSDGARETLAPISVQVLPDVTAGLSDPLRILHELDATGRDPIFLVAEADKTTALVGEEIVVTWWLYTSVSLHQFHLREMPRLSDFWAEEINVSGLPPDRVMLGDRVVQKAPIRRSALFPLHAGRLTIGSLRTLSVFVRRRSGGPFDPFGMFEGRLVEVQQHSQPITIDVRPLPAGLSAAPVGDFSLRCTPPQQERGGPVLFFATLSGRGNVRGTLPPRWDGPVDGEAELRERGVSVAPSAEDVSMTRTWRVSINPARSGRLVIPPLALATVTSMGEVKTLRCEGTTLMADISRTLAVAAPAVAPSAERAIVRPRLLELAAGSAAAIAVLVALFILARRLARRLRLMEELIGDMEPRAMSERVEDLIRRRHRDPAALLSEPSPLGDAYRSLRSLLDHLERNQYIVDPEAELRLRVSELLEEWDRASMKRGKPKSG